MMIRPFTLFCALFAGVSGMVLYAQKHKTTLLDKEITKIVYDTNRIKSQTAMLRTEWTLLNQPDRLKDLSAKFISGLRPLNPSQFVQISSVTSVLPPVQQDQDKDKTREQLAQNVAQSHGQSPTAVVDAFTSIHKEPPIIITKNTETIAQPQATTPVASTTVDNNNIVTPTAPPRPARHKKVKTTEVADTIDDGETANIKPQAVPPTRHKKIKTTEIANAVDAIETPSVKPQPIKKTTVITTQNNASDAAPPIRRKKVKTTEIANAAEAVETPSVKPQPIKRNHIENVSYNIQSGNPFSHNKTSPSKTSSSSQNNGVSNAVVTGQKPTQQTVATTSKKRPTAIKIARNDVKRNSSSESALGGNTDDTLPAPVPFGH